ncbi:MAG: hypothetical protein H0X24_03310 [Ktedonobacterales bacterium]|nr:hypothetical protein [Ktedonobacterales bacterium]
MYRPLFSCTVLATVILLFGFTACGPRPPTGNVVEMNGDMFTRTVLTMPAGTSVAFTDDVGGATHFLATGTDGKYAPEAGAPKELTTPIGVEIVGGQTLHLVFTMVGTYHIMCTIHPMMNVTITVKA